MNLLLDIGNSRAKWALADGETLNATGVVQRDADIRWTEQLPSEPVTAIYVASVAHDSALEALAMHARALGVPLHRVVSGARSGTLLNGYDQPERLGVDRWMACVAAHARGAGSVLVADVGTALTLDWIDRAGQHGGGLIAPGVSSMRSALRASTQLRPRPAPHASRWLARDTDSAIATGTLRCAIALLDAACVDLAPDRLLLTGGEAPLLAPRLAHDWTLVPHLVLEGIAVHATRSVRGGHRRAQASE